MKISIITINLNNLRGLGKTMASVFSQSYGNMEYIVIDGCSTDGSTDLLKSNNDKIAYWISEPDSGVFQAMNKGIKQAKGEYLLFLNSGDFLLDNNVIEKVFCNDFKEDILCGTSLITSNGKALYYSAPPETFSLRFFCNQNIPHQSTFIKRSLFDSFGYYREDLKLKSDYEFWIRTIIVNNCSTRKLNILISDYNLEGISIDPANAVQGRNEMKTALESNIPQAIWTDYLDWFNYPLKMKVFDWARSRKLIFAIMKLFYRTASFAYLLRKKLRKSDPRY
jgi:glycosyltransferase involved in cell wall biosynthesis